MLKACDYSEVDADKRPPALWKRLRELPWSALAIARIPLKVDLLGPVDGPPALVIPGFLADDRSSLGLRRSLAAGGWRVYPWRLGWNMGVKEDLMEQLERSLDQVKDDRPVLVVGWSLGGNFARELARHLPERVRAVVTLGSPFSGDPRLNNVWRLYERVAGHKVDETPIPRITNKPPVPTLALWSRRDGMVAPSAARGLPDESDKSVEVSCNHVAFGVSARATRAVVMEITAFLKEVEQQRSP